MPKQFESDSQEPITFATEARLFAAEDGGIENIVSPGPSRVSYREVLIPNFDASGVVASTARALETLRQQRLQP